MAERVGFVPAILAPLNDLVLDIDFVGMATLPPKRDAALMFTRILCRPARSPFSASSRFPAGTTRSSSRAAASSSFSFRCAPRHSACGICRAARVFRSQNRRMERHPKHSIHEADGAVRHRTA